MDSQSITPTPIKKQTMLPKITEKEARAFVADEHNAVNYPVIHLTIWAWLATKNTGSPCYNIEWDKK